MGLLYITDLHLRIQPPINRVDNFQETMLNKLNDIVEAKNKLKVSAVLCGGDIFDSFTPSGRTVNIFLDFLDALDCPFITIAGNHDIYGHNIDTLPHMYLGIIGRERKNKDFHLIGRQGLVNLDTDGIRVGIHGMSYNIGIDSCSKFMAKEKDLEAVDLSFLMIHSMLIDKSFFGDFTLIKNFKTNVDGVLLSHYHKGFSKRIKDTMFVNPGSMTRISITKYNFNKIPYMLWIDTKDIDDIKYKLVKYKSAKPFEEVFDLTAITDSDSDSVDINELIQVIETEKFESEDITKIMYQLGEEYGFDKAVVKKVEIRLEDKRVAAGGY